MKLIVFLSLVLCLSAVAQPNPLNRRAMAIAGIAKPFNPTPCIASFTNPTQIAGLAFRWVASDGTNAGVLKDRIQTNTWLQASGPAQPVLHGNHLDFDGVNSVMDCTNITVVFENNTSFYMIMCPTNQGADGIFASDVAGDPSGRISLTVGGTYQPGAGGSSPNGGLYTGQQVMDFVYSSQPSGHDKWYTNSAFYGANGSAASGGTWAKRGARIDGVAKYKGAFYEFGIYTNKNLSVDEVCSLHYYATNTYGFTP